MAGSRAPPSSATNASFVADSAFDSRKLSELCKAWTPVAASMLFIPRLHELVTILGGQLEAVNGLQALDLRQCRFRERRLSFQSMQRHPLQQIAERNIQVFRETLEHLHESLLHPRADLHALD